MPGPISYPGKNSKQSGVTSMGPIGLGKWQDSLLPTPAGACDVHGVYKDES